MKILTDMQTCDRCDRTTLGVALVELDEGDLMADCMNDDGGARIRICRRCLDEIIELMDEAE